MLGTFLLLGLAVAGYLDAPLWIIAAGGIAAGFIGLHYPTGKAAMLRERGAYWQTFFISLPLQLILASSLYLVGYGISALLS